MATYELWLTNDRGRRLMPLNNLRTWAASRIINGVGAFSGVLRPPADLPSVQNYHYIERNIRKDWGVQVWRKARGPQHLWAVYFVTGWGWQQGDDGEEVFSLAGYDQNHLLTRRVVAAYADSAQAKMTNYADDMMKAVVTDSLQDDAAPTPTAGTRAWGDLTVQGNQSAGPSLTLAFAWRPLLTLSGGGVLTQIADAAREAGTEVFYRLALTNVSTSGVRYEFRTFIGQPGYNRTSGPRKVTFDADAGTLADWALEYDYAEEVNYVYALGRGDKADRNVQQRYDATRYKASYWGRCEGIAEARMMETDASVQAAGDAVLTEGRPHARLIGTPVSRPGQEYGRHYEVGDKVLARAKGHTFDALVWSAVVSQDEDGRVSEMARLEVR